MQVRCSAAMQALEQVLATQRSVSFLEPPPYTCRGNDVAIPFPSHDMCCEEAGTPVPEVSRHVRLPTGGLARFEHPQSSKVSKLLFLQRMCIPATPLQCPTSTLTLTSTSMTTHRAHPASSTTCRGPRRSLQRLRGAGVPRPAARGHRRHGLSDAPRVSRVSGASRPSTPRPRPRCGGARLRGSGSRRR